MARALSSLAAVTLVVAASAGVAQGEEVDLRASGGLGLGLAAEAWMPGPRIRIDADAATYYFSGFDWGGVGVAIPFTAPGRSFFGARAGYQLEYDGKSDPTYRGSRWAQAPDIGFVGHLEAAGGSAFEVQAGLEALFRQQEVTCCDDAGLPTQSAGFRLLLRGDLALSSALALYAEAGLRTAAHLLEIRVLPTLWGGVRVRL
jgi:hypothetical protein